MSKITTKENKMIKIYQLETGITDWVAANSVDEAKQVLVDLVDISVGDIESCEAITDTRMQELTYVDENIKHSFKEELERRVANGETFPQFFATSDY